MWVVQRGPAPPTPQHSPHGVNEMTNEAARKAVNKAKMLSNAHRVFGEHTNFPVEAERLAALIDEGFGKIDARKRGTVKGQITKGNYLFAESWTVAHYNEVRR